MLRNITGNRFPYISLLAALSVLLSGCSGERAPIPGSITPSPAQSSLIPSATPDPNRSSLPSATAAVQTDIVPQTGQDSTASSEEGGCPITPADLSITQTTRLGPINGQPNSPNPGERLVIVGTIYDRDCNPVPGLTVNVWQTDTAGDYGPPSTSASQVNCCYYGATFTTDSQGRYVLDTVFPGPYRGQAVPPPSHIHVESQENSPAGGLMTEVVFEGDRWLTSPGNYTNPPPISLQTVEDTQGTYRLGVADFKLPGRLPTAQPRGSAQTNNTIQTFTIVPGESSASYQIREKFADIAEMVSPVGVTRGVDGEIRIRFGEPPVLEGMTVEVDLTSLNTGEPDRDEKNYDRWLVTRIFPTACFVSTGLKNAPANYSEGEDATFTLTGDLTIRDVTRPVEFQVTARADGGTITGQAETQILMTDFGIDPPNLFGFVKVENEVVIRVDIKALSEG